MMSYLGSFGSLMSGSGLAEVLQCCFARNTVVHMVTGKAVSRAVRGHFLVEEAINVLLFKGVFATENSDSNVSQLSKFQVITDTDMKKLQGFYSSVVTGVKSFSDLDVCAASKNHNWW
jgi:hypothetical protein